MIFLFVGGAVILLWTGFEAAINGHKALGYVLCCCGLFSAASGAVVEIVRSV